MVRIRKKQYNNSNESKKKLTKKERKALEQLKRVAQSSIKYEKMTQSGICCLNENEFSIALSLSDLNYQIARDDVKESIFQQYMNTLNTASTNTSFQLVLNNRMIDKENYMDDILIKDRQDDYRDLRNEFNRVLLSKVDEGNNLIIRERYFVIKTQDENFNDAKKNLVSIKNEYVNRFRDLGCKVEQMTGIERLTSMYSILHPNKQFYFDYLNMDGLTTKDAITPDCFNFTFVDSFKVDERYSKVFYLKNYSTELSDDLLTKFSNVEYPITISFHMKPIDRGDDSNLVKRTIALMEMEKITEQQLALKRGYDPDMIPMELKYSLNEAENLLKDVQERNQRLFECQFFIMISAESEDELAVIEKKINNIAKASTTELGILKYQQENCLNAILPIGRMAVPIYRTLPTYVCAAFMPFSSIELMEKNAFYYGVNPSTRSLLMFNRKNLDSPSGFVLATPGSGKSFKCKSEIIQILLSTNDDVVVIDPEREYTPLGKRFNGEIAYMDTVSGVKINGFNVDDIDEPDFMASKAEFTQTFVSQAVTNGNYRLSGSSRGLVDLALNQLYRDYEVNRARNMDNHPLPAPILDDFVEILSKYDSQEAKDMTFALQMYTTKGSYNMFAGQTNVNLNNRFTIFDIRDVGNTLKPMTMLVILENLWNKIITNFSIGKRTWIYIDELHVLLGNEYCVDFLTALYKRARKYGGIITGITQNVEELLQITKIRTMLSNSGYILMLNQATSDREELAGLLNISEQQLSYITNAPKGTGLLYNSETIIPFEDRFPPNSSIFNLMDTQFRERV